MFKKDKQQKREETNIKISSHLHRRDFLNMLLVLFVHQPIQLFFHLGGVDLNYCNATLSPIYVTE